jgi:hypothetical protein
VEAADSSGGGGDDFRRGGGDFGGEPGEFCWTWEEHKQEHKEVHKHRRLLSHQYRRWWRVGLKEVLDVRNSSRIFTKLIGRGFSINGNTNLHYLELMILIYQSLWVLHLVVFEREH